MGYITAIIGALGSIGGGLASGAASKPKQPDIYSGFNPISGVVRNLFGMPTVLGKGGLMMPSEGAAMQRRINNIYAQGGTVNDVVDAINSGYWVGGKSKGGLLGGKGVSKTLDFLMGNAYDLRGDGGDASVQTAHSKIPIIGGLFKKGGYAPDYIPPRHGFGFANPIFAPSDFDTLAELKDPVALTEPQVMARELLSNGRVGQLTGQTGFGSNINEVLDYLSGPLMGYGEDWARTGFKTDIKPVQDYADFRFKNFILPELASQFGATTNALSSDFAGQAQLAGADLLSQLGSLDTQLSEAAAGRRMQGIDFLRELNKERVSLPVDLARTLDSIGLGMQQENAALRPGQALLNLLNALNGLQSGQPYMGAPGTPNPFTSSLASSLGKSLGSAIGSFSSSGFNQNTGNANTNDLTSRILSSLGNTGMGLGNTGSADNQIADLTAAFNF